MAEATDGQRIACGRPTASLTLSPSADNEISLLISGQVSGQTTSTGALTGLALDPSGAALPGAVILLTRKETGATDSAISGGEGNFSFLLLPPGLYEANPQRGS